MINKCRYGIVLRGVFTASGHDELHAAFIKKSTAERVLKQEVPDKYERKRYVIVRLADHVTATNDGPCTCPKGMTYHALNCPVHPGERRTVR